MPTGPILVALLSLLWPVSPTGPDPSQDLARCAMAEAHPIHLQMQLLEPLVPGQWVDAEIELSSELDLMDARLVLRATDGVEYRVDRTQLGALSSGDVRSVGLRIRVVDDPAQQQLMATLEGELPTGTLQRGSSLNLLPHGPHFRPLQRTTKTGERGVIRYRGAARRVER